MPSLVLGPLLRYVDERSATIWLQTDVPCEVDVAGVRAPTWAVDGHHFALVVVDGLAPGEDVAYEVRLDGELVWPEPGSPLPPSLIRTLAGDQAATIAFGSCRISRPHEPPHTLRGHEHPAGQGIDALRTYALRASRGDASLPTMLLMLGDQIYADQPSSELQEALDRRPRPGDAPRKELADFTEYAMAYREAWSEPAIRWLLSTVPTAMIFDDHEIHDEWRISEPWMRRMSAEPWFDDHIRSGLMAYWVFQHLGNLAPAELEASELYREVRSGNAAALPDAMDDAGHQRGHSRWSHARDVNHARLVVVDSRAGRDVAPGHRQLIDDGEWAWVREQARAPARHLLLASSVPFLLAPGLHHVEAWDEAVAGGAWGRAMAWVGERLRMLAVMDHWASFQRTFRKFATLVEEVASGDEAGAPASVVMLSGDVHHCYVAEVGFRPGSDAKSAVWQTVCSGFRKELRPHERAVIGFGHSTLAERLARWLSRAAGVERPPFDWRVVDEPAFANQIATLELDGESATIRIEAVVDGGWRDPQLRVVIDRLLTPPRR